MSFNITKRIAGDRALATLTDTVNEQLAQAPAVEHDAIRSVADTVAHFVGDADADMMVEFNLGGAIGENTRSLSLSMTVTQLRPRASAPAAQVASWNPPEPRRVEATPTPASSPTPAPAPAPTEPAG